MTNSGADGTAATLFSQLGYTEPDPRDDLSGTDVARKVVILARESGLNISMEDVPVESLVPEALRECSIDEFMQKLPDYDDEMSGRLSDAAARGEVLRFVGVVDHKSRKGACALSRRRPMKRETDVGIICVADGLTAERGTADHDHAGGVELKTFKADHPFGTLNGSDNMVCFTTMRYCSTPLVVRGPGAGAEVTAGGVFGDLLKLAAYLGAPS